jgi:prophage antirepressor-like protein
MSANPIISFDFDEHAVRTIDRAGDPWFVLADVCRVLDISNPSKAAVPLGDDEKGLTSSYTLGGDQEVLIVSESGLYAIVLRTRSAMTPGTVAYRFRRWVTNEVLPTIRRTGRYDMTGQRAAAQMEQSDRTARRRELPGLMDRLERERNPEKRRVVHALIVKACAAEDIAPPPIDRIGSDTPAPPDIVEPFWVALGDLRAQGVEFDHARRTDMIAISLKEIRELFRTAGIKLTIDQRLREALRLSERPRYLHDGTVNSYLTRKSKACMVFAAEPFTLPG